MTTAITSTTGPTLKRKTPDDEPQNPLSETFRQAIFDHSLIPEALPLIDADPKEPLQISIKMTSIKGPKKVNEDRHEAVSQGNQHLVVIADGHGEQGKMAQIACKEFKNHFFERVEGHDVETTIKTMCAEIHGKLETRSGGSTLTVCFVDGDTHRVITATLGDSEAKIYRKNDGQIFSIPLSCTLNWTKTDEAARYALAMDGKITVEELTQNPKPKSIYFPPIYGVNVSRALGDKTLTVNGKTAISQDPVVTIHHLGVDEYLILATDGLWDYSDENDLIQNVIAPNWNGSEMHQKIVDYGLATTRDNISVIAVRSADKIVHQKKSESLDEPLL